jgi:hypothetical protein
MVKGIVVSLRVLNTWLIADRPLARTSFYRVRNGPKAYIRENEVYLPLYDQNSEHVPSNGCP